LLIYLENPAHPLICGRREYVVTGKFKQSVSIFCTSLFFFILSLKGHFVTNICLIWLLLVQLSMGRVEGKAPRIRIRYFRQILKPEICLPWGLWASAFSINYQVSCASGNSFSSTFMLYVNFMTYNSSGNIWSQWCEEGMHCKKPYPLCFHEWSIYEGTFSFELHCHLHSSVTNHGEL
jgi:hypothetical protein